MTFPYAVLRFPAGRIQEAEAIASFKHEEHARRYAGQYRNYSFGCIIMLTSEYGTGPIHTDWPHDPDDVY